MNSSFPHEARAVIYTRVSTNVQEDNYSFATQLTACHTYAESHGLKVVAEFQEVASGGSLNRPELSEALTLIRSGEAGSLIVFNMDRLSRNLADILYLRDELRTSGATLHFAVRGESSTSAEGDLFDSIEGAFAEYERRRIKERLFRGRFGKIKGTGGKEPQVYGNGNCPYGYNYVGRKKDRKLVIHEAESIVVRNMFLWSLEGMGANSISKRLNEQGVLTPGQSGRAAGTTKRENPIWTASMVWRILKNEVYAGTMYFNKTHRVGTRDIDHPKEEWLGVPVPAIVTLELFEAVQERLAEGRRGSPRNAKYPYLLGRKRLSCQCGYTMTGTGSDSAGWRGYRCRHHSNMPITPCNLGDVKAELVETLVWDWLYSVLTPEAIEEGIRTHEKENRDEISTIEHKLLSITKRQEELDREAERMIAAYKAGVVSLTELGKDKAGIDAERKVLFEEQRRLEDLRDNTTWYDAEALKAEAKELRAYMPFMNDEEKCALLERVYLKAQRRLNDEGEQVIVVQCRLGSATLPLGQRETPPNSSSHSASGSNDIVSPSHSNLRSLRYGWCRFRKRPWRRQLGCWPAGRARCRPPAMPVAPARSGAAGAVRDRAARAAP